MIDSNGTTLSDPDAEALAGSRRAFLRSGSLAALGLGMGRSQAVDPPPVGRDGRSLIVLVMVGGASPWETFDPKPDAPCRLRGPFGSIATALPGVRLNESLPTIARQMDQLTLIRSLYHDADPTHDAGLDLIHRAWSIARADPEHGMPRTVVLPDLVRRVERPTPRATTSSESRSQLVSGVTPGSRRFDPARFQDRLCRWGGPDHRGVSWDWHAATRATRDRFGPSEFGRNCWLAGQLVAAGTRLVVVHMATRLVGERTWDAHGRFPFSSLDDYPRYLLPAFDQGFAGLVQQLRERGQLDSTLVLATGEMGRTPWINESGGRDHWPGVWSALLAGGGMPGGQVIGASAVDGGYPQSHPIHIADLMAAAVETLQWPTARSS